MVFFTDEELSLFPASLRSDPDSPLSLISTFSLTDRFSLPGLEKNMILKDLQGRDGYCMDVVYCSPPDFTCEEKTQDADHRVLEKWKITRKRSPSDDCELLEWGGGTLGDALLKFLPLQKGHDLIKQSLLGYGQPSSHESCAPLPIPESIHKRSITVSFPEREEIYQIAVEYTSELPGKLDSFGKIILHVKDTKYTAHCDHSETILSSPLTSPLSQLSLKHSSNPSSPLRGSSIPIKIPRGGQSPRYANALTPELKRCKSSPNRSRRHQLSPFTPKKDRIGALSRSPVGSSSVFVGSLQESLLSGHMYNSKSIMLTGFSAKITASSPGCIGNPLEIPFDTFYYHLEDCNKTPYSGSINFPKEKFRIATAGTLQVTIYNPNNTPIKVFLVSYDLTEMPANSKTFIRQITRTTDSDHPILQYAIHFSVKRSESNRIYLHKNVRVVFPHRKPDEQTTLDVFCQTPQAPKYFMM